MEKIHFSISINAPKEKVWHTMLDEDTYKQWTVPFSVGSSYIGTWEKGSDIRFVDPDGNGMLARIAENTPYEFVSIEHYGMIKDGVVDTESEEIKKWAGAHENYTLSEADGVTTVRVDLDTDETYKEMFSEMWPKALQLVKELAEK